MMKKTLLLLAGIFASVSVLASPAADRDGVLADGKGMTLYIFKRDSPMRSVCYDGCAKAWPPFVATSAAKEGGDFSIVTRKDGSKQWAYKSQPLYYYGGDAAPGDLAGEGSGGVWYVIRTGAPQAGATSTSGY
jgi:predicted lipoprotein with Yx(FWY)xxD motif